jgi:type 1 glutamine amidotransferase
MNQPPCTQQRILIFSKTAGYRHDSIPTATAALKLLASEHNIQADSTEDSSVFTPENLARYNVVIFLLTSGHILDTVQQQAFEHYIHSGGGYVGVHSATDTEYDWSWYGQLVGAFFKDHPHITQANLIVEDPTHSSTKMLPARWTRTDEWYNFRTNPRKNVHVLLTVDETSYTGGTMGSDHPISWYHDFEGGRSWYTAMGHASAYYHEPLFLAHLWGGIVYAGNLHS